MSKNKDFLTSLKSLSNNLHLGNKTATEIADSLNAWLKDGGEALKVKIEDEVERSVSKMGFVKRGEFEALKQEVAALKKGKTHKVTKKTTAKKTAVKKVVKKTTKKAALKKVAK
jgi:BMFP domain-containing protein YqiC